MAGGENEVLRAKKKRAFVVELSAGHRRQLANMAELKSEEEEENHPLILKFTLSFARKFPLFDRRAEGSLYRARRLIMHEKRQ